MMDETILRRKLTTAVLFIFVAAIAFYAVKSNNPLFAGLLLAVPMGIFFLSQPMLTALLVPIGFYSKTMLPGMPAELTLNYMFQGVLVAWWMGSAALHRTQRRSLNLADKMVVGFAMTMLATMAVRGFGIRMMGSMAYGGMGYLYMFLWIGFYFACKQIAIQEKYVNRLLLGLCFATAIPVGFMLIVFFKPSLYGTISSFTNTSFEYLGDSAGSGDMGKGRWGSAATLGQFIIYYALTSSFKQQALQKKMLLLAVAIFAVLISGFRSTLVASLITIVLWTVIKSKNKFTTVIGFGACLMLFWGLAFLLVDQLPENMQRTVSFLPGVKIHGAMAGDAQASVNWRLEVWSYAFTRIPEYLLVGRGFVQNVSAAAWMQASYYVTPEFAWMMSNYHNGPLSIILTFGLFGTITFFGFFLFSVRQGIVALRRYRRHQNLYAYTLVQFSTLYIGQKILQYIFIMGEVRSSFPDFVLWIVILGWSIRHLDEYDRKWQANETVALVDRDPLLLKCL